MTLGSSVGLIFTALTVCLQLTDEERVYLNAASAGDVPIIRQSLEESEVNSSASYNAVSTENRKGRSRSRGINLRTWSNQTGETCCGTTWRERRMN